MSGRGREVEDSALGVLGSREGQATNTAMLNFIQLYLTNCPSARVAVYDILARTLMLALMHFSE